MKFFAKTVLSILLASSTLTMFATPSVVAHAPDTSCAPHNGVGASDIPHAYYTANGIVTFTNDACPTTYSGELGFGVGGVWLFSRDGDGVDPDGTPGGDGVADCYGVPSFGHHGLDNTINVNDHLLGGAVAFSVTRDWNRSLTNPILPVGNENGDFDCGDSLVEPCDPAEEATAPGCNHLDASIFNFPADGLCDGFTSLGTIDPTDAGFPGRVVQFITDLVTSLLGLQTPSCTIPGPNTWSTTSAGAANLGEFAGADGAVVLFIQSNVRADAGHAGTGTFGDVWTSGGPPLAVPCIGLVTINDLPYVAEAVYDSPALVEFLLPPNCDIFCPPPPGFEMTSPVNALIPWGATRTCLPPAPPTTDALVWANDAGKLLTQIDATYVATDGHTYTLDFKLAA